MPKFMAEIKRQIVFDNMELKFVLKEDCLQFFLHIKFSAMKIRIGLCLLLLVALASTKICQRGEVQIDSACLHCNIIPNTDSIDPAIFLQPNQCVCKPGFIWSETKRECLTLQFSTISKTTVEEMFEDDIINWENIYQRALQQGGSACISSIQILLPNGNCFTCPTTNGGTGLANETNTTGTVTPICVCKENYVWAATLTGGQCTCDFKTAFLSSPSKTCTLCANTTTGGDGKGGCGCNSTQIWRNNACVACGAITNAVSLTNGSCYVCGAAGTNSIAKSGAKCTCKGSLTWSDANGCSCSNSLQKIVGDSATCTCDLSKGYLKSGVCTACPTGTNSTDSKGGCNCTNLNETWSKTTSTCILCTTISNTVILANNSCFTCGTAGTNTLGNTATAGGKKICLCKGTLVWNGTSGTCGCANSLNVLNVVAGTCSCDLTKAYLNTKTSACSVCPSATTSGPDKKGGCICTDTSQVWSNNACTACADVTNGVVTSNGNCFICGTGGYTIARKTVSGQATCTCKGKLTWNSAGYCGCTSAVEKINPATLTCVCDLTQAYTFGGKCTACPAATTQRATGLGGCICIESATTWVNDSCVKCNTRPNIVLIKSGTACFTCGTNGTFTLAKIANAQNDSCSCKSSRLVWNSDGYCECPNKLHKLNPVTLTCTCDTTKAFLYTSLCQVCPDTSNGPDGLGGCKCNDPLKWYINACVAQNVLPGVVVVSGGGFLTCGTNGTFTALKKVDKNNDTCTCKSTGLVWNPAGYCQCSDSHYRVNPTTYKCECDISQYYSFGKICSACPDNSTADGKGGCNCPDGVWLNGECVPCTALPNTVTAKNGTACVQCGGANTNTVNVALSNVTCKCSSVTLKWNDATASCDCGTTSAMIPKGSSFTCLSCTTSQFAGKNTSSSCKCASSNLQWNAAKAVCDCSYLGNAIVVSSGVNAACFLCTKSDFMTGTITSKGVCGCFGGLVWQNDYTKCGCASSDNVAVGSGTSAKCVSCKSIQYAEISNKTGACSCKGTGMILNTAGAGSCSCPAGSIITPDFVCQACPTGATPLTAYECSCPTGTVWIASKNTCSVCGTDVPNSLPVAVNGFTCACSSGYIWDVISQGCVAICTPASASCLTCPNATALVLSKVKNLSGGALVQPLLSNIFSNYASISGFQCPCANGTSWDSKRLKCFNSTLV